MLVFDKNTISALIPLFLISQSLVRLGNMCVVLFYIFFYSLLYFVPLDYRVSATRFITICSFSLFFFPIARTCAIKARAMNQQHAYIPCDESSLQTTRDSITLIAKSMCCYEYASRTISSNRIDQYFSRNLNVYQYNFCVNHALSDKLSYLFIKFQSSFIIFVKFQIVRL